MCVNKGLEFYAQKIVGLYELYIINYEFSSSVYSFQAHLLKVETSFFSMHCHLSLDKLQSASPCFRFYHLPSCILWIIYNIFPFVVFSSYYLS